MSVIFIYYKSLTSSRQSCANFKQQQCRGEQSDSCRLFFLFAGRLTRHRMTCLVDKLANYPKLPPAPSFLTAKQFLSSSFNIISETTKSLSRRQNRQPAHFRIPQFHSTNDSCQIIHQISHSSYW